MFKYNKKIDFWSYKMIEGISDIWGNKIQYEEKTKSITLIDFKNYLNNYLDKYGNTIFKKFNKITGLSYQRKDFKYYINNTPVSLHNSKELFISIGQNHPFNSYPTILIHEIFHIYFYKYIESKNFNKILKHFNIISENEKNELKEIITIIINTEFKDIINTKDKGYPEHKKIREDIIKLWKKNKNFDDWIFKVIKIYKKREQP